MQSSVLLVLLIHYVLRYDLTIRRSDQVNKSPIKSDYNKVQQIVLVSVCYLCTVLDKKGGLTRFYDGSICENGVGLQGPVPLSAL